MNHVALILFSQTNVWLNEKTEYLCTMPVQKIDKEILLKSALRVFKEKGYHKASMADIAKECGLLKGSIYHYFESKEAMMIQVLKYLRQRYQSEVFNNENIGSLHPIDRLRHLAAKSEEIFLAESHGCFFTSIGLETVHVVDDFTEEIRLFFNDWIVCLQNIFESFMSTEEARLNAEQTVAEIEGAVMMMQIYNDPELLRRTHRFLLKRYENLPVLNDTTIQTS